MPSTTPHVRPSVSWHSSVSHWAGFPAISVLALLLLYAAPLCAVTYYVSNKGRDTNHGTSSGTPWRTIAHVNTVTFDPGDSILFQAGGVWREELTVRSSGTFRNDITFGVYGTGVAPQINGATTVPSWSSYSASFTVPNAKSSARRNTAAYTSALPPSSLRTAVKALTAINIWQSPVAKRPGELWINGASLGPPQSSLSSLTSHNQWYWSGGTLYIYSIANPSSSQTLEAASLQNPVYINRQSYVTIEGLEVRNSNNAAIYLRDSNHITLKNMTIHDAVGEGVNTYAGGGGHLIINSAIYDTGLNTFMGNGSAVHWLGTTTPSTVKDCHIHDLTTGTGNHGVYDQGTGDEIIGNYFLNITNSTALKIDAADVVITANIINNSAQGGVYVDPFSGIKITNNTFYNTGTVTGYGGIFFVGDGNQTGVIFKNNVFYVSGSTIAFAVVVNTSATGFTSDYNDVYGLRVSWGEWLGRSYSSLSAWRTATGQDMHSFAANPLFTIAGSNFALSARSPAIGKGVNLGVPNHLLNPSTPNFPFTLTTQCPAWNMGAFGQASCGNHADAEPRRRLNP